MRLFVRNLQATLFTPNLDLSNKIVLAHQLINDTKGLFDGDPVILPFPSDAPNEIPRIILKSKNDSYSMNIGPIRFDFYYNGEIKDGLPTKGISIIKRPYLDNIKSVVESVKKTTGVKIARLGFVPTLQTKITTSASRFISGSYLKQGRVTKDIYDMNLGVLKRDKIGKRDINVWFRINPYRKIDDPLDDKLLSIQFDINTLPEQPLDLNTVEIIDFFEQAILYLESNLGFYIKD